MNLFVVRHGEREDKEQNGVWTGGLDPGITKLGVSQAQLVGEALRKERVDYIYASPFYRTVLTAVEIAYTLGLKVRVEDGLAETLLRSMYPRQPKIDRSRIVTQGMGAYVENGYTSTTAFPNYPEDEQAAGQRYRDTIEKIVKTHANANIVVVTHLHAVEIIAKSLTKQKCPGTISYGCVSHFKHDSGSGTWSPLTLFGTKHLELSLEKQQGQSVCGEDASTVQFNTPPPSEVGVRKGVRKRKKAGLPEQLAINTTEIRKLEAELANAKTRRSEILRKVAVHNLRCNKQNSRLCGLWVDAPQLCAHVLEYLADGCFLSLLQTTKIVKAVLRSEELSGFASATPSITFISSRCTSIRDSVLKENTTIRTPDKSSVIFRARRLFDDDETWDQELALIRDTIEEQTSLHSPPPTSNGQWEVMTPTTPTLNPGYSPSLHQSRSKARTIAAIVSSDNGTAEPWCP